MSGDTEADSLGAAHDESSGGSHTTGLTGLSATGDGTSGDVSAGATDTQPGPGSSTGTTDPEGTTGGAGDDEGSSSGGTGSADESESSSSSSSTDAPLDEVDLSGYQLVQTSSSRTFTIPDGTLVPSGTVVVIGRNASRGAFEQHWGSLPAQTVYLNAEDGFPAINGDETYTLRDVSNTAIDGPTPPMQSGDALRRTGLDTGWTLESEGSADPGIGLDEPGASGTFLTEASDASGSGNFIFEYVELQAWP